MKPRKTLHDSRHGSGPITISLADAVDDVGSFGCVDDGCDDPENDTLDQLVDSRIGAHLRVPQYLPLSLLVPADEVGSHSVSQAPGHDELLDAFLRPWEPHDLPVHLPPQLELHPAARAWLRSCSAVVDDSEDCDADLRAYQWSQSRARSTEENRVLFLFTDGSSFEAMSRSAWAWA